MTYVLQTHMPQYLFVCAIVMHVDPRVLLILGYEFIEKNGLKGLLNFYCSSALLLGRLLSL